MVLLLGAVLEDTSGGLCYCDGPLTRGESDVTSYWVIGIITADAAIDEKLPLVGIDCNLC